ncbi:MAG: AarF/ABC1/UbiB kinase family protein [Rhizobiales bacterium]|nr:AarF/ABC1/UbiB kinase family protein [Hyphomicrobiales bacterium]MBO6700196.1 AarF/ABC1/UbiB kinase family protein [Hyphomicrobiales bacterium]MBO6737639.1 AarF/ABC1/UbiB kinase family protein [Hyphomicrobiales bacterium]MBO6913304.1 AarF/ABC1/UbiB kinase family protein [Hyphomicrobiales bacterium]MBO6956854.1 AarF/ABC1/UbiB kinase family protein [Hyphomicrobiales bacterium]
MAEERNDSERNRLTGRLGRYARVSTSVGGVAATMARRRLFGGAKVNPADAEALAEALGGLKGPLMKVAQLISTIPDAVPAEYAAELQKLQSEAPPMGWAFVKRRMRAELGAGWQDKFDTFEHAPTAAASLGQVHKARSLDGHDLAVKLQYPDMASAVAADLQQLDFIFSLFRRMDAAIDPSEMKQEIAERLREELDYELEAAHAKLYRNFFGTEDALVRVPDVVDELSTGRLLTLGWLDGEKILDFKEESQEVRNRLSTAIFHAWWRPFAHIGVIHGDPHLGNYQVFKRDGAPEGINLLDYGCIRKFPARFVDGVLQLNEGLMKDDEDQIIHAYELWGFENLTKDLRDVLNIWARFINGPLLEDKVRAVADGVNATEYGREQAIMVRKELQRLGPVKIPREFVFMDRAAIGLGGVFLHLRAELNFYQLFQKEIENFDPVTLVEKQTKAMREAGLEPIGAEDHGLDGVPSAVAAQ